MKIIPTIIMYDSNGVPYETVSENIPDDVIFSEITNGQCVCYQIGDTLPDNTNINFFKIKKNEE